MIAHEKPPMNAHYLLYRLLLIVLSPILLAYIFWLSLRSRSTRYFWQRLGFATDDLPQGTLWFHCASVGEVNTALPLLKKIHSEQPDIQFIITTNTTTGAQIVEQQKLDYLYHCYLPFDWAHSVKRFLKNVKPSRLYILETEIWPRLFSKCRCTGIEINIINARLSKKTTSANSFVKGLLSDALSKVTAIYARSDEHREAYIAIGAEATKVKTLGNLKFTTAIRSTDENQPSLSIDGDYVLLASTHDDEEKQITEIWEKFVRDELLVIAPRHPERRTAILKQFDDSGFDRERVAVRSNNDVITDSTDIYLVDTVGELKPLFHDAKLVIMGGSFVDIGGHNILEPAAYNRSIITGPHMHNFAEELALMTRENAILQVGSYKALEESLSRTLDDEEELALLQSNTKNLTHDIEKVLEDYCKLITRSD
jgi:3-deoxy-D-manno-octulosonic-acid transferase